jgi:hypothetical protein
MLTTAGSNASQIKKLNIVTLEIVANGVLAFQPEAPGGERTALLGQSEVAQARLKLRGLGR